MKKFHYLFLVFVFSFLCINKEMNAQRNAPLSINYVTVKDVVDEINQDSVRYVIQTLQNYTTRFMGNSNRKQIYKWIKSKFVSYGFADVEIDSFWCNTLYGGMGLTMQYNVVAKMRGATKPNEYCIIGGHYDCFSTGSVLDAPGADDNASGTAAVLESARAIKKKNFQPGSTLVFIAFAAEELMRFGDAGCEHYAQEARANGMDIKLMINNDMIANSVYAPEQSEVSINYYSGYENLKDYTKFITQTYSKVTPVTGSLDQYSDSQPFSYQNYPAVYFEEYAFSPYYHGSSDRISNCNIPYCTEIIKASCATLLAFQETTTAIEKEGNIPTGFVLNQNYPNPFNPVTTISYSIPQAQHVSIKVFDMLGREVATLVNEEKSAGTYHVQFNGGNLSSGTYLYRLIAGIHNESKKFILLK